MICMNCNSYADLVNFSWHGMFTNLCLALLLLLAGSFVPKFHFNYRKKAREKYGKWWNIIQISGWRDLTLSFVP